MYIHYFLVMFLLISSNVNAEKLVSNGIETMALTPSLTLKETNNDLIPSTIIVKKAPTLEDQLKDAAGSMLSTAPYLISTFYNHIVQNFEPFNFSKNASLIIAKLATITLLHELGHAYIAKLINQSPIKITLGSYTTKNKAPIVTLPGLSIQGFNPLEGLASYSMKKNNLHKLAISAAGPLSALCANYCFKIINTLQTDPSVMVAITNALIPDLIDFHQLCNLLIPDFSNNDATQIYEALGIL